jgi:hypothetical protein
MGKTFVPEYRSKPGVPYQFRNSLYTRQARATREGAAIGWQDNGQRVVEGVINGARTPWQFRIDARIEKDINHQIERQEKSYTECLPMGAKPAEYTKCNRCIPCNR